MAGSFSFADFVRSPSNYPGRVGKFRKEQTAQRAAWAELPDPRGPLAAVAILHQVPDGASTVTVCNPLDPGTIGGGEGAEGWLAHPHDYGRVFR